MEKKINLLIRHQFLLTCSASIPAANNYLYVNSSGKINRISNKKRIDIDIHLSVCLMRKKT